MNCFALRLNIFEWEIIVDLWSYEDTTWVPFKYHVDMSIISEDVWIPDLINSDLIQCSNVKRASSDGNHSMCSRGFISKENIAR